MPALSQEAIQAQMNEVEGSILSRLYKKHIQVGAEHWRAFILGVVGRSRVGSHREQASNLTHLPSLRSPQQEGPQFTL